MHESIAEPPMMRWTSASALVIILALAATVSLIRACSWDYPIWSKSKKSDVALFRFVVNENHAGYIDRNGQIIIRPQFQSLGNQNDDDFRDGLAKVWDWTEGWYVDPSGKRIVRADRGGVFSQGLTVTRENGKDGFVDKSGRIVIPAIYESAYDFSEDLALVYADHQAGYIDLRGQVAIRPQFLFAFAFSNGAARVVRSGPCVFYDHGPCSYPLNPPMVLPFVSGNDRREFRTLPKCQFTFIDKSGRPLFEQTFVEANDFSEGLAAVSDGSLWGYLDTKGATIIPVQYEAADVFSEGRAAVRKNDKWGYIDKTGKWIIQPQFKVAQAFSEGFAVVSNDASTYRFIDKAGRTSIGGVYTAASGFVMGLAHVRQGHDYYQSKWSYIDRSGRTVFAYTDKGPVTSSVRR